MKFDFHLNNIYTMSNTDNKYDDILYIEEPAKLPFVRFDPLIL